MGFHLFNFYFNDFYFILSKYSNQFIIIVTSATLKEPDVGFFFFILKKNRQFGSNPIKQIREYQR